VPGDTAARALALQADGRIVVAGDDGLARYTRNGALDPSFGSGGRVPTDSSPWAVALQPDGRIVVAGVVSGLFDEFVALARYTASGAPDPSFGSGGEVLTDFGGVFTTKSATLALQADGRIVVAGNAGLARYTSNGALDPSFGSGGKVLTDFSASALALQADGRIVVAGYGGLAHYTSNGALDPSFGSGGEVSLDFSASAVALQPDGRIVVAGTRYDDVNINAYFALARYTANGTLDSSFGSTGELLTGFSDYPGGAAALALQPDGRIVAADMRCDVAGNNDYFWLARYTGSGAPDPSFGSGGEVLTEFGVTAAPIALALQPDGQIVVAGQMYDTCGTAFTLARFQSR
jgi:uncharacterized delta-60 repeat protein